MGVSQEHDDYQLDSPHGINGGHKHPRINGGHKNRRRV